MFGPGALSCRLRCLPVLVALPLTACEPPSRTVEVEVNFTVKYGEHDISCVGEDASVALRDFRAYIHDVRLKSPGGQPVPARLIPEPVWQSAEVALLDFENGQGTCANGSSETNTTLRLTAPEGEYQGISFRIGVPEKLNHADPLLAGSPLNLTAMHWHWRSGYKFLRAGIRTSNDGYWMHVGSSRCSGTVGNIKGCEAPNRADFFLADFQPDKHVIVFDLYELTADVDLRDGIRSDCSSGPLEFKCTGPFAAMGIDFATGTQSTSASFVRTDTVK